MKNEKGQIFILAVIVLTLVMINVIIIISGALFFRQSSNYNIASVQAINLAEAGIDKAVASLNATSGSFTGDTETNLGVGSYETQITTVNSNTKVVTSTGYIPNKASSTTKKTVQIQVSKGLGVSFNYGIQAGTGGLQMNNGSTVNGSVYSNSNITMSDNSKITGDAYVAGGTQPVPDQSSDCTSPNCADFIFGKNVSGNNQLDVAQSFQPSSTNTLSKVSLKLKKYGSPPDITVRILGDSSGKPDKSNVLASGILLTSLVNGNYNFVDISFPSPPNLNANTTYWIMLDTTSDSSNYWAWSEDTTRGYTRGSPAWSPDWQASNPSWNTINGDLGFKTYVNGVITSLIGSSGVTIGGNAHGHDLEQLGVTGGAYYQTETSVTAGSLHPGSSDPATQPFSISASNIQDWKDQAAAAKVQTGNITNCPSTLSSGKYIGSMNLPNSCTITVTPPVWITGDVALNNGDILKLDSSYGGSSGIFIVSGLTTISNNNQLNGTGVNGSYLILLSDYDSQDDPLHTVAINITNNGNSGEVYSNLGSIRVSNNNTMTEITAWKLILDNNVTINYDQGLASAFFSSGSGGTFTAVKGTYQLK